MAQTWRGLRRKATGAPVGQRTVAGMVSARAPVDLQSGAPSVGGTSPHSNLSSVLNLGGPGNEGTRITRWHQTGGGDEQLLKHIGKTHPDFDMRCPVKSLPMNGASRIDKKTLNVAPDTFGACVRAAVVSAQVSC